MKSCVDLGDERCLGDANVVSLMPAWRAEVYVSIYLRFVKRTRFSRLLVHAELKTASEKRSELFCARFRMASVSLEDKESALAKPWANCSGVEAWKPACTSVLSFSQWREENNRNVSSGRDGKLTNDVGEVERGT